MDIFDSFVPKREKLVWVPGLLKQSFMAQTSIGVFSINANRDLYLGNRFLERHASLGAAKKYAREVLNKETRQ